MEIQGIGGVSALQAMQPTTQKTDDKQFSDILSDAVAQYRTENTNSQTQALDLLTGASGNLSDVMISGEKAKIALNLTVAIRNKAMDAYKEIMNMQV